MQRLSFGVLFTALAICGVTGDAAPAKKPPRKASTQTAPKKPAAAPIATPVETPKIGGFMVPKAVVMRQMTAAEAEAHAIWNLRAGLNVAALQCQYSGWLKTVNNYNSFLAHHSEQLLASQTKLLEHFKRYDGAKALTSFDQYNTRTYNSYSTLDAQYTFCAAAGFIGRGALTLPKGQLGPFAQKRVPELRAAFENLPLSPVLAVMPFAPLIIPPINVPGDTMALAPTP